MKHFMIACCLAAISIPGAAQTSGAMATAKSIDAQRAQISAERARLEAGFLAEDAACYQKFAVNYCLGQVNVRRREAMAELRRQEIVLNDEERKIRGEQEMKRIEEKSSSENAQEAAQRRAKASEDYQSRLERGKEKLQESASAPASEKAARDANAKRQLEARKKAEARAERQAAAAEQARKFDERQKQAQERRAQHEKDQLARPQPPVKSLPLPN